MGVTRRNTIVGLGALAAGAGVIGGTGAFTAVEAQREVTVQAAGDATALLALEPNEVYPGEQDKYVSSSEDGIISLVIDDLNLNALTRFDDLIRVTNNGTQEIELAVQSYSDDDGVEAAGVDEEGNPVVDFYVNGQSIIENPVTIGEGNDVTMSVRINLWGVTSTADADGRFPDSITLEANATA